MKCPDCGAEMRTIGRGATRSKHGQRWICPGAEREVIADERGHLRRIPGAKHATIRVWGEDELIAELSERLDLAMGLNPGTAESHITGIITSANGLLSDQVQHD